MKLIPMNILIWIICFLTFSCQKNDEANNLQADIVIEDRFLNTNYVNGTGFNASGGTDVFEESVLLSDGRVPRFPNSRFDIKTYDKNSGELTQVLNLAKQKLGSNTRLKFYKPTDTPLSKVSLNDESVQFIVNHFFEENGHDLLVTWVIPPDYDPNKEYVTLLFAPGFSHTNNTKLFSGTPTFLWQYFTALSATENKNIIMVHTNVGGRTSSGLAIGFDAVLDKALSWGAEKLGLDKSRIVISGSSRGGNASFAYANHLARTGGYQVRGIFANVFAPLVGGRDFDAAFEFGTLRADYYGLGDPSQFLSWRDLCFNRNQNNNDAKIRTFGTDDPSLVSQTDHIASIDALALQSEPVYIHSAHGLKDRIYFASSIIEFYQYALNKTNIKFRSDIYIGKGHSEVAELMETGDFLPIFLKDLANGVLINHNSEIRFIKENGQTCSNPSQYPLIFRVPKTTAVNRVFELDLVATSGNTYEIILKNENNSVLSNITGTVSTKNYAHISLTTPDTAGIYYLELKVNGNLEGILSLNVKSEFPQSFTEFMNEWNDSESYQYINDECN